MVNLWVHQQLTLFRMTNSRELHPIPYITTEISPMKNQKSRVALEMAFWLAARTLRFKVLRISHARLGLMLALEFHTDDPYGVVDAVNIFYF